MKKAFTNYLPDTIHDFFKNHMENRHTNVRFFLLFTSCYNYLSLENLPTSINLDTN